MSVVSLTIMCSPKSAPMEFSSQASLGVFGGLTWVWCAIWISMMKLGFNRVNSGKMFENHSDFTLLEGTQVKRREHGWKGWPSGRIGLSLRSPAASSQFRNHKPKEFYEPRT
jgi:hypothetical protein